SASTLQILAQFLDEFGVLRETENNGHGLPAAARLLDPQLCHHPRRQCLIELFAAAAAVGRGPSALRTHSPLIAGIDDSRVVARCHSGMMSHQRRRVRECTASQSDHAAAPFAMRTVPVANSRANASSWVETRIAWPRPASSRSRRPR